MSERVKRAGSDAPPPPPFLHSVLVWLEHNVRRPLKDTPFDKWIATPAKQYYLTARRLS